MANIYTDAQVLQDLSDSFAALSNNVRSTANQKENMIAAMSHFWDDSVAKSFQRRSTSHLQELDEVARILTEASNSLARQAQAVRVYLDDSY